MRHPWEDFATAIRAMLGADDDVSLWEAAVEELFRDAEFLCSCARSNAPIFARIGACSHWLSPHNNGSWLADARYAWPSGYGGSGHSIFGLPEFDWSVLWQWDGGNSHWIPAERVSGKRPLTFRVAVPGRTGRHSRAVVHALWTPGSPTQPKDRLLQAYGFTQSQGEWKCTSTSGNAEHYELTSRNSEA